MFYLMNKDNCIASFQAVETGFETRFEMIDPPAAAHQDPAGLPVGFKDIGSWISGRKAVSHNGHIRRLAASLGCADDLGYIRLTHAGSLNDTFWVKEDTETINWRDVSYYTNPFSEAIARMAFEGRGSEGTAFSPTVPELSTAGSFPKCWHRDKTGMIHLIKGGSTDLVKGGSEPYCEILASEIYAGICDSVPYELITYAGRPASSCRIFTSEQTGFIPVSRYQAPKDLDSLLRCMSNLGLEDAFRAMLLADCMTFNPDRHRGNFGFLVDNDTLNVTGLAPAFDFNQCLFPYGSTEAEIIAELGETLPKIGTDFTRLGQQLLTEALRDKLKDLADYSFSFRGDEHFPETRVKALEQILQRQTKAILSREKLYTHDIIK